MPQSDQEAYCLPLEGALASIRNDGVWAIGVVGAPPLRKGDGSVRELSACRSCRQIISAQEVQSWGCGFQAR